MLRRWRRTRPPSVWLCLKTQLLLTVQYKSACSSVARLTVDGEEQDWLLTVVVSVRECGAKWRELDSFKACCVKIRLKDDSLDEARERGG